MIHPLIFAEELKDLARRKGFDVAEIANISGHPIIALTRNADRNPDKAASLYLSSGVHGDEPAGPLAIRKLIECDLLPRSLNLSILPLINPIGIEAQTRENGAGHDLNRDFRFPANPETQAAKRFIDALPPIDLSLCLHEDWESKGFYMYGISPHPNNLRFRQIISEVSHIGPIETASEIDGSPAENGLISRSETLDLESRNDWPEAFLLYSSNEHIHITSETPSSLPIEPRVEMQTTLVQSAIKHLIGDLRNATE